MSSPSQSTCTAFHRSIIGAIDREPAEECGSKHDVAVSLFMKVDGCALKSLLWPSPCTATVPDDELEVVKSNDNDDGRAN